MDIWENIQGKYIIVRTSTQFLKMRVHFSLREGNVLENDQMLETSTLLISEIEHRAKYFNLEKKILLYFRHCSTDLKWPF